MPLLIFPPQLSQKNTTRRIFSPSEIFLTLITLRGSVTSISSRIPHNV